MTWVGKAKKAAQTAGIAVGLASNVQSVADLPKPLQDQYRAHAKEVRLPATRSDTRGRLESGGRLKNQPTTSLDIKKPKRRK